VNTKPSFGTNSAMLLVKIGLARVPSETERWHFVFMRPLRQQQAEGEGGIRPSHSPDDQGVVQNQETAGSLRSGF